LQAAADGFMAHCQALCQQLDVPLMVQHVNAQHSAGESPEDAARHRLRGFRVCRIGSNRAAALSWCPSVLQRPRIFCVLSPSSASIGCTQQLLRLRAHIYAVRTKTPTFALKHLSEAAAELPLSSPNDSGRCTPALD
jgi:hypothetical protein